MSHPSQKARRMGVSIGLKGSREQKQVPPLWQLAERVAAGRDDNFFLLPFKPKEGLNGAPETLTQVSFAHLGYPGGSRLVEQERCRGGTDFYVPPFAKSAKDGAPGFQLGE